VKVHTSGNRGHREMVNFGVLTRFKQDWGVGKQVVSGHPVKHERSGEV